MQSKESKIFIGFICLLVLFSFPQKTMAGKIWEETKNFVGLVQEVNSSSFQQTKQVLDKSKQIKGIYLTQYTGGSSSTWAVNKRKEIQKLLQETELNAVVIDVKEVQGVSFSPELKNFVDELHKNDIWVIARIVVCRDSSLIFRNRDWYLKDLNNALWQDKSGYYWLDPSCAEVQEYISDVSKQAIDLGFDEIQFDYLRFPDRGNLNDIIYSCFNKEEKKRTAIKGFYSFLSQNLRSYKKDVILSIDLFGLVAQYFNISGTGQNVEDCLGEFDYISFMLYPSHFFDGFHSNKAYYTVPSEHVYEVVFLSIQSASDYIDNLNYFPEYSFIFPQRASLVSLGKSLFQNYRQMLVSLKQRETEIRPWLQDFDLEAEKEKGIYYDTQKVRDQIDASEKAGGLGWLLWNPWNVYTYQALKKVDSIRIED